MRVLVTCALLLVAAPASAQTPPLRTLTAGDNHNCGLTRGGVAHCWGMAAVGRLAAPSGPWQQIDAGNALTCGVHRNGRIRCWGGGVNTTSGVPDGAFRQVSVGMNVACGIRTNGRLACWVVMDAMMVRAMRSNAPALASGAPEGRFSSVAVGSQHACALDSEGAVHCWGEASRDRTAAPAGRFVALSASRNQTCALREDGSPVCWGGAYGPADRDRPPYASPENVRFSRISVGGNSVCGLTRRDGRIRCWGPSSHVTRPGIPTGGGFVDLSLDLGVTQNHACAIRGGGETVCWGHEHGNRGP